MHYMPSHVREVYHYRLGSVIVPMVIILVGLGSLMQGYANNTYDVVFLAVFLFFSGCLLTISIFGPKRAELHAFLVTYSICLFIGGIAQLYSIMIFENPQSTFDSLNFFYPSIALNPPYMGLSEQLFSTEYALPLVVWQQFYKLSWWLMLEPGPYIGVMVNSSIIGLTGALTVKVARELYGNDEWRLRRVGLLFSFCGIFILFGAVLLRGCFTTFFNVLVLWGLVRWIVDSSIQKLVCAIVLTAASSAAMFFLRAESIALFGVFWGLALFCWFFKRKFNLVRLLTVIGIFIIFVLISGILISYLDLLLEVQKSGLSQYSEFSANESGSSSLGMKLVVNQPLPLRLLAGSGLLALYPIPFWTYFNFTTTDYHWILGYNAVYKIVVMPLFLLSLLSVYRLFKSNRALSYPYVFLVLYFCISLVAIVMTSLEQRHLAQFMPAFIVLMAFIDTRLKYIKQQLKLVASVWFALVFFIHLVWLGLKGV